MIYESNLKCPDAFGAFKYLHERPMPHSFGHSVPSDWADKADDDPVFGIYKRCGCWTRDERAILAACATQFLGKPWIDIGAHTGVTAKTINWMTNAYVACVDPMLAAMEFRQRFRDNTGFPGDWMFGQTSRQFFSVMRARVSGVCIDGDHEWGEPLYDAIAAAYLAESGVILLHDGIGAPVQEAVTWLMDHGFKARVYQTPHVVFACWRGDFTPPDHQPDPRIVRELILPHRCKNFEWKRCV